VLYNLLCSLACDSRQSVLYSSEWEKRDFIGIKAIRILIGHLVTRSQGNLGQTDGLMGNKGFIPREYLWGVESRQTKTFATRGEVNGTST
jgi:hypothetical protein